MVSEPIDPKKDAIDWLDDHGDELFRFAMARVNRKDVAEELVQETFLAAVAKRDQFRGEAKVKTWLIGILRRKIVDYYRKRQRGVQYVPEADDLAAFFSPHGHIKNVSKWSGDPSKQMENREFWETFQQCMKKLRTPWAEVFTLRVMDGMTTSDICESLEISESNLSVRLHRARLALRDCLERNWFQRK